jgi:hypothetical protein
MQIAASPESRRAFLPIVLSVYGLPKAFPASWLLPGHLQQASKPKNHKAWIIRPEPFYDNGDGASSFETD